MRLTPSMSGPARQFAVFLGLGAFTTGAYLLAYNLLREGMAPILANSVAMLGSVVLSYFLNRRYTFGREGRGSMRELVFFTAVFVVTLVVSDVALAMLFRLVASPQRAHENLVLLAANGLLTILRFWMVRRWVFTPEGTGGSPAPSPRGAAQ